MHRKYKSLHYKASDEIKATTRTFESLCCSRIADARSRQGLQFCHFCEFPVNPSGSLTLTAKPNLLFQQPAVCRWHQNQWSARLKQEATDINLFNFPNSAWLLWELSRMLLKHDIKCHKNKITQSLRDKGCCFTCNTKSLNLNCIYF